MTRKHEHNLEEELSAYLDGELDEARRIEVEAYLAEHADAGGVLNELRQTVQLVKGLEPKPAPEDLIDALMARLERRSLLNGEEADFLPPTRGRRLGRYLATAAVLLLTASVAVVVFQQQAQPGRVPAQEKAVMLADRGREETPQRGPEIARAPAETRDKEKTDGRLFTGREWKDEVSAKGAPAGAAVKRDALGYVRTDNAPGEVSAQRAVHRPAAPAIVTAPAPQEKAAAEVAINTEPTVPPAPTAAPAKGIRAGQPVTLAEAEQEEELGTADQIAPDKILNVVCADASSQLSNADAAEAYFLANNVEVVGMALPSREEGDYTVMPRQSPGSPDFRVTAEEPQFLIRATGDQVAAINSIFINDRNVVHLAMVQASPEQVAVIESSPVWQAVAESQAATQMAEARPTTQTVQSLSVATQPEQQQRQQSPRRQVLARLQTPQLYNRSAVGQQVQAGRTPQLGDSAIRPGQNLSTTVDASRRVRAMQPAELPAAPPATMPQFTVQTTQAPSTQAPSDHALRSQAAGERLTVLIKLQQRQVPHPPPPVTRPSSALNQ